MGHPLMVTPITYLDLIDFSLNRAARCATCCGGMPTARSRRCCMSMWTTPAWIGRFGSSTACAKGYDDGRTRITIRTASAERRPGISLVDRGGWTARFWWSRI